MVLLVSFGGAPALANTSTIVVIGDSLSAGYGLNGAPSWVDILEDQIEQGAYEYAVVNASICGDTSSSGLSRLPRLLDRHDPAIVIIELGGNDGLRGLPPGLLRENLAQMIELVIASGARPLLTGIQMPPSHGPAYAELFAGVYTELAERFEIAFVGFLMEGVALDPARMQADRVHPNAAGQQPMFENVWAVLEAML
jgi:acyl-CoA thioesterase-1